MTLTTMAGYSGKPLIQKLGFKAHWRVLLVEPPPNFVQLLKPWPDGIQFLDRENPPLRAAVVFARELHALCANFSRLATGIVPDGMLWVAWPKKSSGVITDVTEGEVRATGLAAGWVDIKICAVDDTWSGLKFVRRKADRGGSAKQD